MTLISQGEPATFAAAGLPPPVLDEGRYAAGDGPAWTRSAPATSCSARIWPTSTAVAGLVGHRAAGTASTAVLAYPFDVDA